MLKILLFFIFCVFICTSNHLPGQRHPDGNNNAHSTKKSFKSFFNFFKNKTQSSKNKTQFSENKDSPSAKNNILSKQNFIETPTNKRLIKRDNELDDISQNKDPIQLIDVKLGEQVNEEDQNKKSTIMLSGVKSNKKKLSKIHKLNQLSDVEISLGFYCEVYKQKNANIFIRSIEFLQIADIKKKLPFAIATLRLEYVNSYSELEDQMMNIKNTTATATATETVNNNKYIAIMSYYGESRNKTAYVFINKQYNKQSVKKDATPSSTHDEKNDVEKHVIKKEKKIPSNNTKTAGKKNFFDLIFDKSTIIDINVDNKKSKNTMKYLRHMEEGDIIDIMRYSDYKLFIVENKIYFQKPNFSCLPKMIIGVSSILIFVAFICFVRFVAAPHGTFCDNSTALYLCRQHRDRCYESNSKYMCMNE